MKYLILFLTLFITINTNSMASYEKVVPIVKKYEGGWAGNIDGKTCTNSGVTLETYRLFYGKDKTCDDLKKMSDEEWKIIFKKGFWDKWLCDSIENQAIANLLADWVWHSGTWGIKHPQRVLGVKDDGIVGPKTLAAINEHPNKRDLFYQLWKRREAYLISLNKPQFIKGWLNRIAAFEWFED